MRQGKQVHQLGATGQVVSPLDPGTNRWAYGNNNEAVAQTIALIAMLSYEVDRS
ncbi:MAG TPA: hypothetical protein VEI53_05840 [Ktedonobacteraceae bacterium]|nr:hypothetical protein [Ktedonobacteraceae bacterium]